jgi:hypothetical protein
MVSILIALRSKTAGATANKAAPSRLRSEHIRRPFLDEIPTVAAFRSELRHELLLGSDVSTWRAYGKPAFARPPGNFLCSFEA